MANKHDTIGIDCVAMCVNDIAAQGAEPLFFLDYIACGKNDPALLEQVVAGVADGCVQAGSGLIGGETAEMPGMYDEDEYDLAGFAVGVAEKSAIVDGSTIAEGDVLIGLPSTGVHSNGFSLVRKALFEKAGYTVDTVLDELDGEKLGDVLLTPTKIYVKALSPLFKAGVVKGVAHITGGGFIENVPRMIPDGLAAHINLGSWPVLPIFDVLERPAKSTIWKCSTSSTWVLVWCWPSTPKMPIRPWNCSSPMTKPVTYSAISSRRPIATSNCSKYIYGGEP